MIYTIRNQCVENPELPYDDGARTLFLYTKGKKGRDNESLSQLLDYMENTTRENAVTEELEDIQEMVDVVKEIEKLRKQLEELQKKWEKYAMLKIAKKINIREKWRDFIEYGYNYNMV